MTNLGRADYEETIRAAKTQLRQAELIKIQANYMLGWAEKKLKEYMRKHPDEPEVIV